MTWAEWPEMTFAILMAAGVVADLWLVYTGRKSISLRTWIATKLHPTLVVAGVLVSVGIAMILSGSVTAEFMWGFVSGHLWAHR